MIKNLTKFILLFLTALLFSNCAATLYDQGRSSLDDGQYIQAIAIFKEELKTNPYNYQALRDLGIAELKNNDLQNAEVSLLKAKVIKPGDDETIFYLGMLSEKLGDYDEAIDYYKKCLSLKSLSGDVEGKIEGRIQIISQKKMEQEIKTTLQNEESLSQEPVPHNTVAVLYFQNLGTNKEMDVLQRGLAEMLITDLSKVKDLKVVERVRLQKLLDEMKLSSSEAFDQQSAPRLGRLMKAERLVKGTYLSMDDNTFRVDAGFIGTQDGSLQQVKNVSGSLEEYFKLQKELVFNIVDQMGITLSDQEREAIQIIPTESYLAFVAYSKGLDQEDKGNYQEAAEYYQEAITIDPSFKIAKVKLNEVQNIEQASTNFSSVENDFRSPAMDLSTTMDRLIEGSANLTGEMVLGRDDRNPNNSAGFGRGVKVEFELIVPR